MGRTVALQGRAKSSEVLQGTPFALRLAPHTHTASGEPEMCNKHLHSDQCRRCVSRCALKLTVTVKCGGCPASTAALRAANWYWRLYCTRVKGTGQTTLMKQARRSSFQPL